MRILIDGKRLDVTLENERTAGEVLAALEAWLSGSGLVFSGICVDGTELQGQELDRFFGERIDGVEEIALRTSPAAQLCLTALLAAQDVLERRKKSGDASITEEWERSSAAAFLRGNEAALYGGIQERFSGKSDEPITDAIEERRRELEHPFEEFIGLGDATADVCRRLEKFSLDMQTGNDGVAAGTVNDFSLLSAKILRLIPLLRCFGIRLETLDLGAAFFEEYTRSLKDFFSAYGDGDTVLAGDMAEYEIAPRTEKLYNALAGNIRAVQGSL